MHVGVMEVELHLETSRSLKDKRSVVKHLLDTSRRRFGVSASEVAFADLRQRAALGFAYVASSPSHVEDVLDAVERLVWAQADVSVTSVVRRWMDPES